MANNDKRSRGWCFTINNYNEEDTDWCYGLAGDEEITYCVVGKEVGESGTPHYQGYIYWRNKKSFQQMKNMHAEAHWEIQRGTVKQAANYCTKDGDFFEHGTMPMDDKQKGECGKQSIEERWALARAGEFDQLPPEQIKTYQYIHNTHRQVEDRETLDNIWVCGKSGCGKSRWVREKYGNVFYNKPMSKWWDGYNGEDVVVLDDYDPKHSQYLSYFLKIWTDHYKFNGEVKGGMLPIRPKIVIVTSQYTIDQCFEDVPTRNAIKRRFKVKHMAVLDTDELEISETLYDEN